MARRLASALCENAKRRGAQLEPDFRKRDSFVDIMVLAGAEVPLNKLQDERERQLRVAAEDQPGAFALKLADLNDIISRFRDICGVSGQEDLGIPRSVLANALAVALQERTLGISLPRDARELTGLAATFGNSKYRTAANQPFGENYLAQQLCPLFSEAPLSFLYHVLGLWDLIDLFDTTEGSPA